LDDEGERNYNGEIYEICQGNDILKGLIVQQKWFAVMKYLTSHDSKDNNNVTTLHVACATPTVPVHVINAIIQVYPHAYLEEDEDGSLPIHVACSTTGISLLLIQHLMIACPKSCLLRDQTDGELPLYLLLQKNHSLDIELVNRLITRLPASCIYNETTSLIHEVCTNTLPEAIINQIIDLHPQVCYLQCNNGDTLLHILCSQSYLTPTTLCMILKHHPDACSVMDHDGNLPLYRVNPGIHYESTIRKLIHEHPKGTLKPSTFSYVPLKMAHVREMSTKTKSIVDYNDIATFPPVNLGGFVPIQDSYYEMQCDLTCFITNARPNISLSLHPKSYPNLEHQIKLLLHLTTSYVYGREDVMDLGSRMSVPHQLCFWTRFPLFTKMMLQQSSHVAKKKDEYGELPLHTVVKHSFDMHMIRQCYICKDVPIAGPFLWYGDRTQVCVKCYRKSIDSFWKSPPSNRLPLILYQHHEVIKDIVKAYPQAAFIPDRFGNLPLHLSLYAGCTWDTGVKEIFQAAPDAIYVRDHSSGLLPFMIAASKKFFTSADHRHATEILTIEENKRKDKYENRVGSLELATIFHLLQKDPSQAKI